jgi:hypothetical protein
MSGRKEYKDVLYLIDFGLSKKYCDPKTGQHVKFINNRRLNGTARYASIHALEGYETSRRDDLEGLCYVLIYFLNGHLPWERIKNKNKPERYKLILNMKKKISSENLVGDKNNIDFIEFVKYCKKLKFEEKPDYDYLRGLMINCISKNNKSIDNFYNIDINKNPLFHYQDKKDKLNGDFYFKNISQNISGKNTRCNSTKRLKISFASNMIASNDNNDNNENNENDDYNNKIINESKSSTLGYIGKKVRNYSSFKRHGMKEIQRLIELKKKVNNSNGMNYIIINKNKTAFRSPDNSNNLKCISFEKTKNKKYSRSRFNFIKRSLGIEEKPVSLDKNDSNGNFKMKKNVSDINDDNNNINDDNNNINDSDKNDNDGCSII